MNGLAAAGDDDTRTVAGLARLGFDGGGQVHERGDPAQHPLGVINQADQFSQSCLTPEINGAVELGVVMAAVSNLDKLDSLAKMINDVLITARLPPFDRQIIFAAPCHNPERDILADNLINLGMPDFLLRGEVNVAFK